jgi:FtsP/CotA-like multicopper oxidase with cupredoxin domain
MRRGLIAAAALAAVLAGAVQPAYSATRTYYIAADPVVWNYLPSGRDEATGAKLPRFPKLTLGVRYHKIVYREYTDGTFSKRVVRPEDAYMGLLGPTIHAEVGDTIRVVFKNDASIPTNIVPRGLIAAPAAPVAPHAVKTYTWKVSERAAPGAVDGSSIGWPYFSTVDENRDENTGMLGLIVVTKAGAARLDGTPSDVDREVYALFTEVDETQSRLIDANVADPVMNPHHVKAGARFSRFFVDNSWFSINGYVFGNMPMPTMREGSRVRWYVIASRSDFDAHMPHWHGETVLYRGMRMDMVDINDDQVLVADMVPDNPGIWLFHCHLNGHLRAGMEARFDVLP